MGAYVSGWMPFRIAFRTTAPHSLFKTYLHRLISARSSTWGPNSIGGLVLASGYFDSRTPGYRGPTGTLFDEIALHCAGGTLLLVASAEHEKRPTIATGMGKYSPADMWLNGLREFVDQMDTKLAGTVAIDKRVGDAQNWHAKISIRLVDNVPVAALIGSSNMTEPAYNDAPTAPKFEGDALLWQEQDAALNRHFGAMDSDAAETDLEILGEEVGAVGLPGSGPIAQAPTSAQLMRLYNTIRSNTRALIFK